MEDVYTIVLDVNGGTYVDQRKGLSPQEALLEWAKSPNPSVLSAFRQTDVDEFLNIVEESTASDVGSITPLNGLQAVWSVCLIQDDVAGFVNVIRTRVG